MYMYTRGCGVVAVQCQNTSNVPTVPCVSLVFRCSQGTVGTQGRAGTLFVEVLCISYILLTEHISVSSMVTIKIVDPVPY